MHTKLIKCHTLDALWDGAHTPKAMCELLAGMWLKYSRCLKKLQNCSPLDRLLISVHIRNSVTCDARGKHIKNLPQGTLCNSGTVNDSGNVSLTSTV